MDNPDSVMTINELLTYLKVSKSTLYKRAYEGKLPGRKVGRHWRFHKSDRLLAKAAGESLEVLTGI